MALHAWSACSNKSRRRRPCARRDVRPHRRQPLLSPSHLCRRRKGGTPWTPRHGGALARPPAARPRRQSPPRPRRRPLPPAAQRAWTRTMMTMISCSVSTRRPRTPPAARLASTVIRCASRSRASTQSTLGGRNVPEASTAYAGHSGGLTYLRPRTHVQMDRWTDGQMDRWSRVGPCQLQLGAIWRGVALV